MVCQSNAITVSNVKRLAQRVCLITQMFCVGIFVLPVVALAEDKAPISSVAKDNLLAQALMSDARSEAHKARDKYRHPSETLQFFSVKPDMTVVEIWPGADGWYTEILAPYLRSGGKFYAAQFNPESDSRYFKDAYQRFSEKLAAEPAIYDHVTVTHFDPPGLLDIAPAGTVDRILTFRNVHNWYMNGGEKNVLAAFKAFNQALKPGGILGVVDHRLPAARSLDEQKNSGYMRQDYVIKMAEQAGFKLIASSEINANAKDTAQHPKGVWTLPPTYALKDQDRETYRNIGESDRMTLKFIKP